MSEKRYRLRNLKLHRIAAVSMPAQEGATAAIIKGATSSTPVWARPVAKQAAMTSSSSGHQHIVDDVDWDDDTINAGYTGPGQSPGDEDPHCHPWSRDANGAVTIGETLGHSHSVAMPAATAPASAPAIIEMLMEMAEAGETGKSAAGYYADSVTKEKFTADQRTEYARSGIAMPDGSFPIRDAGDLKNAIHDWGRAPESKRGQVAAHIKRRAQSLGLMDTLPTDGPLAEALGTKKATPEKKAMDEQTKAELAKFRALAEMTDAQKAHYNKLAATEQGAFLAKSATERSSDVEKAAAADEIVYTAADGSVFRKSDDARLVAAVKRADGAAKDAAIEKAAREAVELEKRADAEIPLLKGTAKVRAAILKALDSIADDETRKAAIESLKGANGAYAELTKHVGHVGATSADGDAKAVFNLKLDEFAKAAGKTAAAATADFVKTREGASLYAAAYPRAN
jgi:hypothetical protein